MSRNEETIRKEVLRLVELEVVKRTRALFDRMERHARDAEKAKREKSLLLHEIEMLKRQLSRFVPSLELALGEQKTSDISSERRAERHMYTVMSRKQGTGLVKSIMMKKELDQLEESFERITGVEGQSSLSPISGSSSAVKFTKDSAKSNATSTIKPRTLASSSSAPLPFRILSSRTPSKGSLKRHLGSPAVSNSGSASSTPVKLSTLLEKWGSGSLASGADNVSKAAVGAGVGSGAGVASQSGAGTGTGLVVDETVRANAPRPTREEIVKRRREMMAKKKKHARGRRGHKDSVEFVDGAAVRIDQDGVKHRYLRVSSIGTTVQHYGSSPFVTDETV